MSAFRWVISGLAICGLGLPLAVAGATLSGIGHRWVDILVQFTAPALIGTLVALGVLLLLRLWPAVWMAGFTAGLLAIAVWPQWMPDRAMPLADAPELSLYSANLWARNTDVEAIAASIAAADADVVVLIELGDAPGAALDQILAAYPHRVTTPRIDRPSGAARSVVASRYPLTEIADRPDGLHAVAAIADTPLGPVNVVGVHLTRPWPYDYQWGQISQVMALTEVVADLNGPVIVAGDFNSVSNGRIGRQVKADIGLIPAPGWPGTWPSALPSALGMTIDQVWRSSDLALLERRLGQATGSDHRPVVTRFTRAASSEAAGSQ